METLSHDEERQTPGCLGLIKSLNDGLGVLFVVHFFRIVLMGARTVHMDDCDECEWSLCSPYALLLSLLSWYGENLSLKCRRGSCFSCGAVSVMVSKCQVLPIPHGGSFDLFQEYTEVLW